MLVYGKKNRNNSHDFCGKKTFIFYHISKIEALNRMLPTNNFLRDKRPIDQLTILKINLHPVSKWSEFYLIHCHDQASPDEVRPAVHSQWARFDLQCLLSRGLKYCDPLVKTSVHDSFDEDLILPCVTIFRKLQQKNFIHDFDYSKLVWHNVMKMISS